MNVYSLIWWAGYVCIAVVLQGLIPGYDALVSGFLIALQEKKRLQTFWIFILFCLIQEGVGSLTFGTSILWYGGQAALFYASARFIVAESLLSVIFLCLCYAAYRGALIWLMCALQDYPIDYQLLLGECGIQALVSPILWLVASWMRPKVRRHAH